ncbi:MAG TPA: glycosyltransferase family 4 protein [Usitatibacter sp.]|nr:glycosyltransferase family 4 protein [Usitatibacter sp.]
MAAFSVLHVTSVPGGGVDRHIRDIARASRRPHLVWHAADNGDAIELLGERRAFPLDRRRLEQEPQVLIDWLRGQRVGVVHTHSVTTAPRERARWITRALGVRNVVTLHDVLFLSRDAFAHGPVPEADPQWLRETSAFIADAAAVLAPSDYLAGVARTHLPGIAVEVVPNGSGLAFSDDVAARHADFGTPPFRHVAAVLGMIGPHKGARVLEQAAERLEGSDAGIVVIGYLDECNLPGWHRRHLFVHGTYQDAEVRSLLRAYGARIGLFTNQVPESFSYALSDLWAAGVPVIVPPNGALGERVGRHGAGWLLPERFTGEDVANLLKRLFSAAGSAELARVESQLDANNPDRVPSLQDMSRPLDALYERFGLEPSAPVDAGSADVQRLLATTLDGSLFRAEMVRFADEIAQLRKGLAHERGEYARVSGEMKQWITKLEGDIAALQAQLAGEARARSAAETGLFEQRNENERTREALGLCRAELEGVPRILRRLFRKKLPDARG